MSFTRPSIAAPEFDQAVVAIDTMSWRPGVHVERIASPQRVAPHSIAIAADLKDGATTLSTGRLILLHDPLGNESWDGTMRLVTLVHADLDETMITDPLFAEAAWSWLTEALETHDARHRVLAGTVTASYGRGFGELTSNQSEGEIRASWTPELTNAEAIAHHLRAWQDVLGHLGGRPPLPSGVVSLHNR